MAGTGCKIIFDFKYFLERKREFFLLKYGLIRKDVESNEEKLSLSLSLLQLGEYIFDCPGIISGNIEPGRKHF